MIQIKMNLMGERRCISCDAHVRDCKHFYMMQESKKQVCLCSKCARALEGHIMRNQEEVAK